MSQTLGKGTSVGNSQMEWLYDSSSGKPTNDDYLMGKAVDKNFERMGTEGQINAVEYDCCPESIFSSQVDHQVDLQRKLQEDPLVSLRKKEVDTRKKILDNPLKLREITSYVSTCCCYLKISFDAQKCCTNHNAFTVLSCLLILPDWFHQKEKAQKREKA